MASPLHTEVREAKRAFVLAAKDRPCVDCGRQLEPAKMHFDHREDEVKSFDIAKGWSRSMENLEAEIAKCDVRCTSCHGKKHARERTVCPMCRRPL